MSKRKDRVGERAMAEVVQDILRDMPKQTATFKELRIAVPKRIRLSRGDRAPSPTRPGEQMWEQIVRNIIVHKRDGFARARNGIRLRGAAKARKTTRVAVAA